MCAGLTDGSTRPLREDRGRKVLSAGVATAATPSSPGSSPSMAHPPFRPALTLLSEGTPDLSSVVCCRPLSPGRPSDLAMRSSTPLRRGDCVPSLSGQAEPPRTRVQRGHGALRRRPTASDRVWRRLRWRHETRRRLAHNLLHLGRPGARSHHLGSASPGWSRWRRMCGANRGPGPLTAMAGESSRPYGLARQRQPSTFEGSSSISTASSLDYDVYQQRRPNDGSRSTSARPACI